MALLPQAGKARAPRGAMAESLHHAPPATSKAWVCADGTTIRDEGELPLLVCSPTFPFWFWLLSDGSPQVSSQGRKQPQTTCSSEGRAAAQKCSGTPKNPSCIFKNTLDLN